MLRRQDSDVSDVSWSSDDDAPSRRQRRRHEDDDGEVEPRRVHIALDRFPGGDVEGDFAPLEPPSDVQPIGSAGDKDADGEVRAEPLLPAPPSLLPVPNVELLPRDAAAVDATSVVMQGIDRSVTGAHLKNLFEHFGILVVSAKRVLDPTHKIPREEFVLTFAHADDVQVALHHMHGGSVNGRTVSLRYRRREEIGAGA